MNAPGRWRRGFRVVLPLALASLAAGPPPATPRRASAYARPRAAEAVPAAGAPQLDRLSTFERRALYGPVAPPPGSYGPRPPQPEPAPVSRPITRPGRTNYYPGLRPGQHPAYPVGHAHCTPSRVAVTAGRGY